MSRPWDNNPSFIELGSLPSDDMNRISQFVSGANAMLSKIPIPTTYPDPMKVECEFRSTGNCHVWLVWGEWRDVDGETCEVFPSLPWNE